MKKAILGGEEACVVENKHSKVLFLWEITLFISAFSDCLFLSGIIYVRHGGESLICMLFSKFSYYAVR